MTHAFGIPIIMVSLPVLVAATVLFVMGWTLQFIGHAIVGKPPDFLQDWRFSAGGSRGWFAKMCGKA